LRRLKKAEKCVCWEIKHQQQKKDEMNFSFSKNGTQMKNFILNENLRLLFSKNHHLKMVFDIQA